MQCAHPPHHHNGFVATCRLWTASDRVHALLIAYTRHVATKPLWCWRDGHIGLSSWHHYICIMLFALWCWALCVSSTNFCFNKYIYAPFVVLVEHSDGSNTKSTWTLPLAVHSRHVATKPLWWLGGWAHWIFFMTSLYVYIYIYI